ncbi:MAG: hydrogenase 3 maturation endopeptidase HyCI [Candidatus Bathyarchaeota archaeon]|nr:MAG: hydrogenase 3 maturation endopeptidase HyCI [Candidatus Bathyarchaeota archaeon]
MKGQSTPVKGEIEDELRILLSDAERVVVAGIGNPLRKDDSVGVAIVRRLRGRVSQSVYLIECETVPESFMKSIIEFSPTHILLIDAAILGQEPGSSKLVGTDQLANQPAVSTHALPLQIFCRYLVETTGAKIAVLGIQPKDAGFGEGLTMKLKKTALDLTDLLSRMLP